MLGLGKCASMALICLLVAASAASGHDQLYPIQGKRLVLKTSNGPRAQRFSFRSVKQPLILPLHDPAVDGAALLVRGVGANGGRTPLIQLDPTKWIGLGNPPGSKGYKYNDRDAVEGGVFKVIYRHANSGGKLVIKARRDNWPWDPSGSQDEVWVHFQVENEWYCARFGGQEVRNEAGKLVFKNASAPASCPASVCGNGVTEPGEDCDDGNLSEIDGCASDCSFSACDGEGYNTTFEAIQDVIFDQSGCNNLNCHSSAAPGGPAGNLDLDPAVAHDQIVNVASSISPLDRIEPGEEDLSFLYNKLAAATFFPSGPAIQGSPMPAGGVPAVTTDVLEGLRLWIRAGAPETGVVDGTASLFDTCLPPPDPQKIPQPDPPAFGTGFQLHAAAWDLPAYSENEVCYSIYYDLDQVPGAVPASAKTPCPAFMGGPGEECFRYHRTELAQDPQSHHSIIRIYRGVHPPTHVGWGDWTCKGGANDGLACTPTGIGTPAPLGADCGAGSACGGEVVERVACIFYGPPDLDATTAPSFGGAQEPLSQQEYADGVYNVLPMKGVVVVNSHAFNLTASDTTMEQYMNLWFAEPADQLYQVLGLFDTTDIFVQNVPPFETREYCRTFTFPDNTNLFQLTSHMHKRGVLFRSWEPPNSPCSGAGCIANVTAPLYLSTEYNDPVQLELNPPEVLTGSVNDRTYKFCAKYDNGFTDPADVKRFSTSPNPPVGGGGVGGPCAVSETRCIGGPNDNQLCNGSDAFCDSSPGAGDGDCDACPLRGGVTTEDEMFIPIGSYYVP